MSPAAAPHPPEQFARLLEAAAARFGTNLSPASISGLSAYLAELDRWRRRINLTGALSAKELGDHALESVAGASLVPDRAELIDIGSGGGVPGIPLAVVRPDIRVTPLEPRGKRMAFLRHVARVLALQNIFPLEGRTEELPEATWNVATARGVGNLSRVLGEGSFLTPAAILLVWTTEPEALASAISGSFRLEKAVPLPASRRKRIAVFRKR
ncbi:MAG: 16S rRNA (guanine(527)-N(7))-methyltransferase RsmG [Thermoanaerobaculia bacterium]